MLVTLLLFVKVICYCLSLLCQERELPMPCFLEEVDGKVQGRSKRASLCIFIPRERLRQGSAGRAVVLYEKIRNRGKVCVTCTGYVSGKRNSGEACSKNYKNFQGQGRTAPGISAKSVSVCSDYEQANGRSKERTNVDSAVC